jgi:plastocyanin
MSRLKSAALIALAAAALPFAARAETVEGVISFTGAAPVMAKQHREADAFCNKTPMNEEIVVVKNGKLANVWVHVIGGAPDAKADASAPTVVVEQSNCMYRPRMSVAMVGQKVEAKNNDPTLHNVHTYAGAATVFNKGMPNEHAKPIEHVVEHDGMMKWKCDVHPWMKGFVGVNKNPYQVVATEGTFKIENVPPGKYKLEAWHEKFGAKTLDITVSATTGSKGIEFKFDGTEKGT